MRPDRYHEIETVTLTVDLFDTLLLERRLPDDGDDSMTIVCVDERENDLSNEIDPKKNLVVRAAELFARKVRRSCPTSAQLIKRIPTQAGLGGGSSDAAAALRGLNQLWNTRLSTEELRKLGAEIGSDVPLFFASSLALGQGRGERVRSLFPVPELNFVLFKPSIGLSTADVYAASDAQPPRTPVACEQLLDALRSGETAAVGQALFNRLEESAERLCPELTRWREKMLRLGAEAVRMTGSGSCLYGLCEGRGQAERLAEALKNEEEGEVFIVKNVKN